MTEELKLILIICMPIVISFLIASRVQRRKISEYKEVLKFNKKGTMTQGWFIISAISGAAYFLIFLYISVGDRPISLTPMGIEIFLKNTILPIGILSSFSITTLIISRLHSSYQVQIQIEKNEEKSNIEMYYSFKKEILSEINETLEVFANDEKIRNIKLKLPRASLQNIYKGDPRNGVPEINEKFMNAVWTSLEYMVEAFTRQSDDDSTIRRDINDIYFNMKIFFRNVGLASQVPEKIYYNPPSSTDLFEIPPLSTIPAEVYRSSNLCLNTAKAIFISLYGIQSPEVGTLEKYAMAVKNTITNPHTTDV